MNQSITIDTQVETFAVGDKVALADPTCMPSKMRPDTIFVVAKAPTRANEVNYRLDSIQGGPGLRAPGYALRSATDAEVAEAEAAAPEGPSPTIGAVVTSMAPKMQGKFYVVTGYGRKGSLSVALLGGEDGKYWPNIPANMLSVVDPSKVSVDA